MHAFRLSILAQLTLLAACQTAPTASPPTWYHDVKPITDAVCADCHKPGGIAPFSLQNYAEVFAHRELIKHSVQNRTMPPWMAKPGNRPLHDDMSLSDAQIQAVSDWVAAGGPEGTQAEEGPKWQVEKSTLSRVDVEIKMREKYLPSSPHGLDDYRCFVLDWPVTEPGFITGFRGIPDQEGEVHHLITYLIDDSYAAKLKSFEDLDPEPGYSCYGTPTADGKEEVPATVLGTWVPGSQGHDFAGGTGIAVKPGSRVVVQVHYNLASTVPTLDQSKVQMSFAKSVSTKGLYLPFFNLSWFFAPETMLIPADVADVVHQFVSTVGKCDAVKSLTTETFANGARLYGVFPHEHAMGKSIRLFAKHADGTTETLVELPQWNFHWQREYMFKDPIDLSPNDQLGIECHWDNSSDAQPTTAGIRNKSMDLKWGESTKDEMCISFIYVSAL